MKKTSLLLMVLALCTAVLANTIETKVGESSRFTVLSKSDPDKFNLVYVSEIESRVTIKILDENGNLVGFDIVKGKKSFSKTYDFGKLEKGRYTFEIENTEGSGSQPVIYDPYRQKLNMVVSSLEESKYKVMVAGFNPDNKVTIRIYDSKGKLVKEDKIKTHRNFSRTYDLSNLEREQFTFTAASGAESILKVKKIK